MNSILPIITMSELQRSAKEKLEGIKDYAVIRKHGQDMAFVLHPALGKVLVESGLLDVLKQKIAKTSASPDAPAPVLPPADQLQELDRVIGQVIRELSRR
jgi:hypothetical protein